MSTKGDRQLRVLEKCAAADAAFTAYLSTPCQAEGCDRTGDHNQAGRTLCTAHLDPTVRAFARND